MKLLTRLSIAGLLLVPALASADLAMTTRCVGAHFLRFPLTPPNATFIPELRFTLVQLENADPVNPATIQRLTVRDYDGSVIHDSGAEALPPSQLPISNAFVPPTDPNAGVPPGAVYAVSTTDIWGLSGVNSAVPPARSGTLLSITVKATKRGNPNLFRVNARGITRERLVNPANGTFGLGAERSASGAACDSLEGDKRD